jgi:ABC-type nitrate/sulfonate/bicarbonate transport system substrate-binding protein
LLKSKPEAARAAIRAVQAAQQILRNNPERATEVGRRLFPPAEADMIAELIRRDAPYYDASIAPRTVDSMNRFARDLKLLSRNVGYEDIVWKG